jgi:hypothetical protein
MNTELAAFNLDIKCFAGAILAQIVQSAAPFLHPNMGSKFISPSATDSFVDDKKHLLRFV